MRTFIGPTVSRRSITPRQDRPASGTPAEKKSDLREWVEDQDRKPEPPDTTGAVDTHGPEERRGDAAKPPTSPDKKSVPVAPEDPGKNRFEPWIEFLRGLLHNGPVQVISVCVSILAAGYISAPEPVRDTGAKMILTLLA